jgi:hypothetical protein
MHEGQQRLSSTMESWFPNGDDRQYTRDEREVKETVVEAIGLMVTLKLLERERI